MDAIVAVYSDWGIGEGGTQPLVVPEDRRRFAELTRGATLVVGRRTLADFPGGRPLAGRDCIVLSRTIVGVPGVVVVPGVADALRECEGRERVFVVGGASVYMEMFPHLDRVFVTKIDAFPHCDAYFPNLDRNPEWSLTDPGESFESKGVSCRFCVYERIRPDGGER